MTFSTLALIALIALAGPLLALRRGWHVPVVLGELIAGVVFGATGTRTLHASDPTFTLLANIGFGLVMFVAGSHVPVRDRRMLTALRTGAMRVIVVVIFAVGFAIAIAAIFGTGHAALYSVLLACSSAALVMPIISSLGLGGPAVLQLVPQVAIADAASIVALPLVIDPRHALRAALGALAVAAAAVVVFFVLRWGERRGLRQRMHDVSIERGFALELRVDLVVLFALCALATRTHVSIMLAGFALGIAVAAVGEPRRLTNQLFALTEGFLGPMFFVWLGASLDLRALGSHPSFIVLGVVLGLGAVLAHFSGRLTGQPIALGGLASAQLGVPVGAATIGTQLHVLKAGEPAALILGALVTIGCAAVLGARAAAGQGNLANPTPSDNRQAPQAGRQARETDRPAPEADQQALAAHRKSPKADQRTVEAGPPPATDQTNG